MSFPFVRSCIFGGHIFICQFKVIGFIGLLGLLGLLGVPWHPLPRIGATGRSEWPHHVCESHFHLHEKLLAIAVFVPLMIGLPSINALFYCYTEVINFHRPKCFVPY